MAASLPKLITCPYNMSHQLQSHRMQPHLEKCRKQYPDAKKTRCPFDATHIINEPELDFHINTCSKRAMFDQQLFQVEDVASFEPAAPPPNLVVASNENWDNDNFEGLKPGAIKDDPHVIKKVKGATPSERRKARMEGVKSYKPK